MSAFESVTLGRTGLKAGPLGVAPGYGAPAKSFEEAFERGCNYFYWGASRKPAMAQAVKNICANGKRDDLLVVVQSFSRSSVYLEYSINQALKKLGVDYADIMLLGWFNNRPPQRLIDRALRMKEMGMFKFLGMSGHNRKTFAAIENDVLDVFHVRYNAVHRGAEKDIFPSLNQETRPGMAAFTATCWGKLLKPKNMPEGESVEASDCYRFALSSPSIDVCMCGPKDHSQMQEALKTLDKGPMDEEEIERMRRIGDHIYKKKKR